MDLLLETDDSTPVTYYPDPGYMRYREVRTLARDHDRDDLTEMAATLTGDIEEWREEFGVDDPSDLRASVARLDVSEHEVYDRLTAHPPASV